MAADDRGTELVSMGSTGGTGGTDANGQIDSHVTQAASTTLGLGLEQRPTALVLTPQGQFFHGGCFVRFFTIFGAFWLLAVLPLTMSNNPAMYISVLGPTIVIICSLTCRYKISVNTWQIIYTFLEAVAWMVPLFCIVPFFDFFANVQLSRWASLECNYPLYRSDAGVQFEPSGVKEYISTISKLQPREQIRFQSKLEEVQQSWLTSTHKYLGVNYNILVQLEQDEVKLDSCGMTFPDAIDPFVFFTSITRGSREADTSPNGIGKTYATLFLREASVPETGSSCTCQCKRVWYAQEGNQFIKADDYCVTVNLGDLAKYQGDACRFAENVTSSCGDPCPEYDLGECLPQSQEPVKLRVSYTAKTLSHTIFFAYVRAAFMEESLKYLAVRRILFKDRVVDCGGLIIYGLAAAAGFAIAENIQYYIIHGPTVVVMRMISAIPLHCCTGIIIGIHLGYRKFLGKQYSFVSALGVPVLIHGTYDFMLMIQGVINFGDVTHFVVAMLILIAGFVYARYAWLSMDNVCVVNLSALESGSKVSNPSFCCCEGICDCLTALAESSDPLLRRASVLQRLSAMGQHVAAGFFPALPTCQTVLRECDVCSKHVYVNIVFESYCPYCGFCFKHAQTALPADACTGNPGNKDFQQI